GVVRRADGGVLRDRLVVPRRAEVAEREAHVWPELVLDLRGDLLVVRTEAPAHARGVGPRRVDDRRAEQRVVDLAAFAVGRKIGQHAVGLVIAVDVVPRAGDARNNRVGRRDDVQRAGGLALEIDPPRSLDGGLAVAEEVVRGADTWRDVLVVRQV